MRNKDLIKMAGGNLARRKSRTFLTVLGIVIGTISVVLMVALGLGMQESFDASLSGITSVNVLEVSKGDNVNSNTRQAESKDNGNIGDMDLDFFKSIEGVEVVSPVITSNVKMTSGKYEATIQVIGLEGSMMEALGYNIEEGRLLSDGDTTNLVFGASTITSFEEVSDSGGNQNNKNLNAMARQFARSMGGGGMFGGKQEEEKEPNVDIFGDRINMSLDIQYSPQGGNSSTQADIYRVRGIGTLEEGDMTRDRYAYMNIDVLMDMVEDYNDIKGTSTDEGYEKAYVKAANTEDVDSIQSIIESYGYEVSTSASFLETIQSTADMLQIALGAIGAIALLVAAIGITNTMFMAIHERKREIGVMKVIGATLKDIQKLFLLEAAMIGLLGGAFGIGISVALSKLFSSSNFNSMAMGGGRNPLSSFTFSIPTWLILVGLVFTTMVGIVSGYIPANYAMKSSALEAIRTE